MKKRLLFVGVATVLAVLAVQRGVAKEVPRDRVICPVIGQPVEDKDRAPRSEYKGQTYYFCCPSCKEKFDKDPRKYAGKMGQGHEGHQGHKGLEPTCGGASGCEHQGH